MMKDSEMVFGIRAVREVLEAGGELDHIYVKRESNSALMSDLLKALGAHKIPIRRVPLEKLNRLTRKNHQGVIGVKAVTSYHKLEDFVPFIYEKGEDPFLVLLDGITDVRNFGAIARTCECAGVHAVVIFEQNSVSVSSDALKTSAGALARLPICRAKNVEEAITFLRDSGVKVLGATEKAEQLIGEADYSGPLAVVMGSEEKGLSPFTLRHCDNLVRIPLYGAIGSLNVSVAAGIVIYEAVRHRSA